MELAIHDRPACLDVGDIEEVRVGATGEADAEPLPHGRVGAVAAGEIRGLAGFLRAVGAPQACAHAVARILEAQELDAALDRHAHLGAPLDTNSLVVLM